MGPSQFGLASCAEAASPILRHPGIKQRLLPIEVATGRTNRFRLSLCDRG